MIGQSRSRNRPSVFSARGIPETVKPPPPEERRPFRPGWVKRGTPCPPGGYRRP